MIRKCRRMKSNSVEHEVQVSSDGMTVWVHSSDGSTVGRFSVRFGMDVHRTVSEQLAGAGQCLHCTHRPATPADWDQFVETLKRHHGISIRARSPFSG